MQNIDLGYPERNRKPYTFKLEFDTYDMATATQDNFHSKVLEFLEHGYPITLVEPPTGFLVTYYVYEDVNCQNRHIEMNLDWESDQIKRYFPHGL